MILVGIWTARVCIKMTRWALVGIGDLDNWKHWKLRWWIFAKVPVDVFSSRSEVFIVDNSFLRSFLFTVVQTMSFVIFVSLVFISCSSISLTRACPGASIVFAGYELFHFTLPWIYCKLHNCITLHFISTHYKKIMNCSSWALVWFYRRSSSSHKSTKPIKRNTFWKKKKYIFN